MAFKNREDKLIILYDSGESVAASVAQQLAQRNILNVWIVSGGTDNQLNHETSITSIGLKSIRGVVDGIIVGKQDFSLPELRSSIQKVHDSSKQWDLMSLASMSVIKRV